MYPPFTPSYPTVTATSGAGSSSAATQLTGNSASVGKQVRVLNPGSQMAFIEFGGLSVQASATDTPIPPNVPCIFTVGPDATHVAVFASAAQLVYFTSGHGE